jgi:hypothetical protein
VAAATQRHRLRHPATPAPAAIAAAGASADQASRISAGLARFIPYATVILAAFLPLAAGLYLLTTTAWTLGERILLRRAVGDGRAAAEPTPGAGSGEARRTPRASSGDRPAARHSQTGAGSVMQRKR